MICRLEGNMSKKMCLHNKNHSTQTTHLVHGLHVGPPIQQQPSSGRMTKACSPMQRGVSDLWHTAQHVKEHWIRHKNRF